MKTKVTCSSCNSEFLKSPSLVGKKLNFCNNECKDSYHKKRRIRRQCQYCRSEFEVYPAKISEHTNSSGNFCSRNCYSLHLKRLTGKLSNRYSKIELKCDQCESPILTIPSKMKDRKSHFCSNKCRYEFHKGKYSGSNNGNWRGGFDGYRGTDWREARKLALKTQMFCAICGTMKNLHVHHIVPYRLCKSNDRDNLITLCPSHHMFIERLTDSIVALGNEDNESFDYKYTKFLLNTILRSRQIETFAHIRNLIRDLGRG